MNQLQKGKEMPLCSKYIRNNIVLIVARLLYHFFFCRSQKENLKQLEAQEEQRLLRGQKEYLDLEMRKYKRRKILAYHKLEQDLLREELNKRQQQLEQAHSMLLRHHEKTQDLEYRQQKAVHQLKEEQVSRQHHTEIQNQEDYMKRAERELMKKHALELKQQPKSLKVW